MGDTILVIGQRLNPLNRCAILYELDDLCRDCFPRRGIARALTAWLRTRLLPAGSRSLPTGFFRPQFFYRLGFKVERRYAGLVLPLTDENEEVCCPASS